MVGDGLLSSSQAGAVVRFPVDGRRRIRSHGLLAAGGVLLWADVEERAEIASETVPVQVTGTRRHGPSLVTSLQVGPAFISRTCLPLQDRPGVALWYEHAGGPGLVLRVRVLLAFRAEGALAFASDAARLTPVKRKDSAIQLGLYPGTPPVVFHPLGAAFVFHPLWRAVRYVDDRLGGKAAEEDLPSPGVFFATLKREGAFARIVAVADDGEAPEVPDPADLQDSEAAGNHGEAGSAPESQTGEDG